MPTVSASKKHNVRECCHGETTRASKRWSFRQNGSPSPVFESMLPYMAWHLVSDKAAGQLSMTIFLKFLKYLLWRNSPGTFKLRIRAFLVARPQKSKTWKQYNSWEGGLSYGQGVKLRIMGLSHGYSKLYLFYFLILVNFLNFCIFRLQWKIL